MFSPTHQQGGRTQCSNTTSGLTEHEVPMYSATPDYTPATSDVILVIGFVPRPTPTEESRAHEVRLLAACRAVVNGREAEQALSSSIADLRPDDPRHSAICDAIALVRPRWKAQLAKVCAAPACTRRGIVAKSELLSQLIDRNEADEILGGAVQQVAASLADDVLAAGGVPSS